MSSAVHTKVAWRRYFATGGLVAVATIIGALARSHLAAPDFVMLYLLGVVIAATRFGRGPALFASALSVLGYDFFFVTPNYTFAVSDERHLLTFATLFIVGLSISALAESARRSELKAQTEEMRSSLLSTVSHDLRTPLAAITGAATTLRERASGLDDHQRAELIDAICVEAERLERLVANLLDMSRLQSGVLALKREWVPLEEVIGAAHTRFEEQFRGRPLRTTLPPDLPLVFVDPVLLEQVFVNLFDNAVKHTPPATPLEISARAVGGAVEVAVADRGPGLEPGTDLLVFEKFYRGGQAAGGKGAGLGLAICRGIVQAHKGTIRAETRPGGGAQFTVRLPLEGRAPPVPHERESLAESGGPA